MHEMKLLKGVGEKEERMYEHIKADAEMSGRYGKRAKKVAARTVLKHLKEEGHRTGESASFGYVIARTVLLSQPPVNPARRKPVTR
jgi:hypothetical protein